MEERRKSRKDAKKGKRMEKGLEMKTRVKVVQKIDNLMHLEVLFMS